MVDMKLSPDFNKSGCEYSEQVSLFQWLNLPETRRTMPDLYNPHTKRPKLFATHQNFNDRVKGARAKAAGIQSGVADLFLPLARQGCFGLFVEMKIDPAHPENAKRKRKGRLSDEQRAFAAQVREDGYGHATAEGWREAAEIIRQYMAKPGE
jgi:hypothetical protein